MKPSPPWKRPERWLAFVLTLLGVCAFLAIVPVGNGILNTDSALNSTQSQDALLFIDSLRAEVSKVQAQAHWTSLLPPLIAVMVAAFFRTMVGALVSAFLVGSFLSYGMNPLATGVLGVNDFLLKPALSQFSAYIILFLFSLVGMVHVMSRSGGLSGLVQIMGKVAKGRRRAKVAISLGGLLIFFDDYSNTVVLGTTMQKLSDRWKISREKLAYLVDSTTAPVAGLALLSTWIAYEAVLLGGVAAEHGVEISGYGMLVEMLPFRFYCIGTLIFVFLTSSMGRDFGPMLAAERRAFHEGKLVADEHEGIGIQPSVTMESNVHVPERWYNALVPIGVVIASIAVGILFVGSMRMSDTFSWSSFSDWRAAFGAAVYDPANENGPGVIPVLLFAAIVGGVVAVLMPVFQGILSFKAAVSSYARGLPTMWMAVFILTMTWSMQEICETLGTAHYLIAMLGDGMPLWLLPALTFFLAAGMSFATGTSWGTMGILIPILMPLAVTLGALEQESMVIYLLTAAAILDGAIFGDHCSPISDTTVLSSISTGCDHIAHVSTQLYYALATVVMSCLFGYLSISHGLPLWLFYVLFPLGTVGLLLVVGKKSQNVA